MISIRQKLTIGCVAALLLSVGAYWLHQQPGEEPRLAQTPITGTSMQWRVGSAQHYELLIDSSMTMKADNDLTAPSLDVLINANLELRTLEAGTDTALVGIQLSALDMKVAGKSDPLVNKALTYPFRVRYVSGGIPESFEFPVSVIAENRLILENLVRMFQVKLQANDEWVTQESTALGHYQATYRRITPTKVSKTKHGFSSQSTQPLFADAMITSNESVEIDQQRDWITTMSSSETLVTAGQGGPALTIHNQATLKLLDSALVKTEPDAWTFVATAPPSMAGSAQTAANLSPNEAQRHLMIELDSLNNASEGRIVMIHRLRDLLRVNGSQPDVLLDAMQSQELTDRTRADIYLAFELAGTVQAQAALASVIADQSWSSRDALRAIVAVGGVATPTAETITALWDLIEITQSDDENQLGSTATFALGSLGKTMRLANAPEYTDLQSRLLDGAMAGASTSERTNYIHALGNTQDASLASNIVVLLQDKAAAVRRATAQSLGAMGADPVADELLSTLVNESNGSVRGSIAEALVKWSTPSLEAMNTVQAMLQAEQDENARLNMALFLGANLEAFPENEKPLRQLLRVEPSKHIRQQVAEVLATNS